MRSLPTVVMLPTPFEKTSRAGWVQRRFLHNLQRAIPMARWAAYPADVVGLSTRERACSAHITEPVSRNSEESGRMSAPHHPCDAPRRRPCLPLHERAARRSRRVTKWGYPPYLYSPGSPHEGGGIRHRAGTARHCPASGNACTCQSLPLRGDTAGQTQSALPCRPGICPICWGRGFT